jgi:hypothetical protein
MGNRNLSQEISGLKSRKEFESYNKIHRKLNNIQSSIEALPALKGSAKVELTKYIPVALVATMESFLRSTVAKLINSNDAIMLNAKDLLKHKFDLEIFSKVHKREFTIGDFLSHQISFSKLKDIFCLFDDLLKKDFVDELKNYTVGTTFDGYRGAHPKDFAPNFDTITKDVMRVFELRHIICHEMSDEVEISKAEIEQLFKSVRRLIYQIYNYTYVVLYPDITLSDEDLHKRAAKDYKNADEKLNMLLEKISANPETAYGVKLDLNTFKISHEHWRNYIENYAKSLYAQFGGNVKKTLILDELTDMIEDRIDDLTIEFIDDHEF